MIPPRKEHQTYDNRGVLGRRSGKNSGEFHLFGQPLFPVFLPLTATASNASIGARPCTRARTLPRSRTYNTGVAWTCTLLWSPLLPAPPATPRYGSQTSPACGQPLTSTR